MDPLTVLSLVSSIAQLVDFGAKLGGKTGELYQAGSGVLDENFNIEVATKDLIKINEQVQHYASDPEWAALCQASHEVAKKLLKVLTKVKTSGKGHKRESFRKAMRSIWCKEEIESLEKRLSLLRDELNLRITFDLREKMKNLEIQNADSLKKLDEVEKDVLKAIVQQKDIFDAIHKTQLQKMDDLQKGQKETKKLIITEHENTRQILHHAFRRAEDLAARICHWLSAPDPALNYQKALKHRKEGTGLWFLNADSYKRWKSGDSSFLWLNGMPGCGKSVLSSTILEELWQTVESNSSQTYPLDEDDEAAVVAYFYFAFDEPEKRVALSLVLSLLTQLGLNKSMVSSELESLYLLAKDRNQKPSLQTYLDVLRSIIQKLPRVYIVIDALDECEERVELLDILSIMWKWKIDSLRILMTSRPEWSIKECLEEMVDDQDIVKFENEVVDKDIQHYVRHRLATDKSLLKWNNDESIRGEIEETIMKGAHGMFRWAACQLDSLGKCRNKTKLRQSLGTLPPTLHQTYERILSAIPEEDVDYAIRILCWLSFSERPLRVEEIAEVIAIDPDREVAFDEGEVLKDPLEVLDICSGLVTLLPFSTKQAWWRELRKKKILGRESQAVVLAHYSVQEYLISDQCVRGPVMHFSISSSLCHQFIARSCLSYLLQLDDPHYHSDGPKDYKIGFYAALYWKKHTNKVPDDAEIQNLIFELLSSSNCSYSNWLRISNSGFRDYDTLLEAFPPLYFAAYYGFKETVSRLLLAGCAVDQYNLRTGNDAIMAASTGGHHEILELLLEAGSQVEDRPTSLTVLQVAVSNGHLKTVEVLVNHGFDVNYAGGGDPSPVMWAVLAGHTSILEYLIAAGADIHSNSESHGTILGMACRAGNVGTLEFLLGKGVDIEARGGFLNNPLQCAAYSDSIEVLELLLARGFDVNITGGSLGSPLFAAVYYGRFAAVELLLSKGADISLSSEDEGYALRIAAGQGYLDIVEVLLANGANINASHEVYGTALDSAREGRHRNIVDLLLAKGATTKSAEPEDYFLHGSFSPSDVLDCWDTSSTSDQEPLDDASQPMTRFITQENVRERRFFGLIGEVDL